MKTAVERLKKIKDDLLKRREAIQSEKTARQVLLCDAFGPILQAWEDLKSHVKFVRPSMQAVVNGEGCHQFEFEILDANAPIERQVRFYAVVEDGKAIIGMVDMEGVGHNVLHRKDALLTYFLESIEPFIELK